MRRVGESMRRALSGNGLVLYACDLGSLKPETLDAIKSGTVERKETAEKLSATELDQIIGIDSNPSLAKKRLTERFEQGASLYLFKAEGKLAGYGWTLVGRTVEPHFFPLNANDVHLFDFFVLPEFRGRRINPLLVNHILKEMALEKKTRAFIEAAEWNHPQLASLARTPFRPIGTARKCCVFGRTVVVWSGEKKNCP